MPQVRSADDFMRRFVEIQPRLRHTIHALTHPPGATLSLYGIGRLAGAGEGNIRYNDTKARYALGLTVVNALNTAVVFLLGGLLFGSARIGLLAAALWFASPAATVYGTFAQDGVYALFFHLALAGIWTVVSSERPLIGRAVLLGIAFSVLTLLTYSWCIVTTVFAVFAIVMGVRERWDRHRVVINGLLPLGVMTLLTGLVLAVYRLDYLAAYRVARAYHEEWYRFTGIYQWALALAGGQLEMVLMFGSVAGAVFLALLVSPSRLADVSRQRLFLLVLLAVYALPIVLGPHPLKMETSRCWLWIGAVPLAFVARDLSARPGGAFRMGGAVSVSVLTSYLMRLFLDFGI